MRFRATLLLAISLAASPTFAGDATSWTPPPGHWNPPHAAYADAAGTAAYSAQAGTANIANSLSPSAVVMASQISGAVCGPNQIYNIGTGQCVTTTGASMVSGTCSMSNSFDGSFGTATISAILSGGAALYTAVSFSTIFDRSNPATQSTCFGSACAGQGLGSAATCSCDDAQGNAESGSATTTSTGGTAAVGLAQCSVAW